MRVWAVLVTDYSDDSFRELYIFETYDKADEYVRNNAPKWETIFNYEIYERLVA